MTPCAFPACGQAALTRSRYCAIHQLDAPYDRGWLPVERDAIDWLGDRVQRDVDGELGPERLAARMVLVRLLREEPDLLRLATGVSQVVGALARLAGREPPEGELGHLGDAVLRELDLGEGAPSP